VSIPFPLISRTTKDQRESRLKQMVPHFTPEWSTPEEDVGSALIKIFSLLTQETLDRLNRTPLRNMLAFLDLLGIRLAPKTPATAFSRSHVPAGAPQRVIVPARPLVTASPPAGEIPFKTEKDLNANRGSIAGSFGVDPANDAIYQPPKGFLQKTI